MHYGRHRLRQSGGRESKEEQIRGIRMRLTIAIRAFFSALFHAATAQRIALALRPPDEAAAPPALEAAAKPQREPKPAPQKRPVRSDAVSLLATLQREARFVDLVQETLDQYSDEQVGAAARDVLRDCRSVLDRLFKLRPVIAGEEGQVIEVPIGYDAGRFRLTGNVAGEPPLRGSLVHHGWEAVRCELPQWAGSDEAARVVAPAEIQLP